MSDDHDHDDQNEDDDQKNDDRDGDDAHERKHENFLVSLDHKLSSNLALCNNRYFPCRGRQLVRGIARSTHPSVWVFWLIVFVLVTRDAALHARLVNLLVGSIISTLLGTFVKLIVRRHRPIVPGGHVGYGLGAYSFPSGHASLITLASCSMARAYNNEFEVMVLMESLTLIICLSMVVLGRQYVLDIIGGCFLGYFTHEILTRYLVIPPATSEAYIKSVQAMLHI